MRRAWATSAVAAGFAAAAAVLVLPGVAEAADTTLVFDGDVPIDGPDHFFVPFDVPAGTVEIEVGHAGAPGANILDFGLVDANGYRGWGGGTSEPTVVGVQAASRAYVPGPIAAGPWRVVVGKALIMESPATYHVEVTLRSAATLPAQTDRKPYAVAAALATGPRWYAADFHAHSRESTDARANLGLDEMLDYAAAHGLDAVEITDHNTVTQFDYFADAQARHPHTLLIPGIEYTTYAGHANALGATHWIDHKIGQPGVTIAATIAAIHAQGALFSINHPALDLGNLCIGCAWKHDVTATEVQALEVQNGAYSVNGIIFYPAVMRFWENLLDQGGHVAALGGSDDHKAGVGEADKAGIGHPATMVWAEELSVAAILDGIENGRTVVKLEDVSDPMVTLTSDVAPSGDTVHARSTILRVHVTETRPGTAIAIVKNGQQSPDVPVTGDPFDYQLAVDAPAAGEDRYRVELAVDGVPHTLTSHLFLARDQAGPDPVGKAKGGCAFAGGDAGFPTALGALLVVAAAALTRRRRRRYADK
jgi:hypothetical protein